MYWYRVKEIEVVDGDTVKVLLDLGCWIYHKTTLRLYGINAPELRGDSKEQGLQSKERLQQLVTLKGDQQLWARTERDTTGKYGRLLASLFLLVGDEYKNLNKQLIAEGLANEYE